MSNMFAILGESDDEDKVKVAPKKDDKKKDAAPAKTAAAPAATTTAPKAKAEKDGKEKRAPRESKPKDGDKPKAAPATNGDDDAAVKNPAGDRKNRLNKGAHHGHGFNRATRAENEAAGEGKTRPKREFDRRSSSGRSGEQRRGGRGPYSAGNPEQEAQEAEKGVLPAVEGEETAEAEVAEPEVVEEVVETPQLPAQKTFDDFMKAREESRGNSEIFGSVRVREVTADFGNMQTADKDDITFVGGLATGPAKKAPKKEKKVRTLISDVGFTSAPVSNIGDNDRDYRPASSSDRARPERGDRAGDRAGRGGRGRGGRGGRGEGPRSSGPRGPNFGDEESFPSL